MSLSKDEQKILAAESAINALTARGKIFSGMKIGLGTGSTAMPAVRRLARIIAEGKISGVKAVATSFQTTLECEKLGIPIFTLNSGAIGGALDLAIDGADEIDSNRAVIKGGGGALLREKITASASRAFVIVADESKALPDGAPLGCKFPVPVEIFPDARVPALRALQALGASCVLREAVRKAGPVVTDNGNLILDCLWESGALSSMEESCSLESRVNEIPGVVECGLFTRLRSVTTVFIAHKDGSVEERSPN